MTCNANLGAAETMNHVTCRPEFLRRLINVRLEVMEIVYALPIIASTSFCLSGHAVAVLLPDITSAAIRPQ